MEERDKQLLKMIRKHPEEGMGLLTDEYGGAIYLVIIFEIFLIMLLVIIGKN